MKKIISLILIILIFSFSIVPCFAKENVISDSQLEIIYNDVILKLEGMYSGELDCEDEQWLKLFEKFKIIRSNPFEYHTVYTVNQSNNKIINFNFESSTKPFKFIKLYDQINKLYSSISSNCSYFTFSIVVEDDGNYSIFKISDVFYNDDFVGYQDNNVYGIKDLIWTNHDIYDLDGDLIYNVKYDFNDILYFTRYYIYNIFIFSGIILEFILSNDLLIIYHSLVIIILLICLFRKIRR